MYPLPKNLQSSKLFSDKRVAEAKKILIDTVKDHQKSLTSVKPADPSLKIEYQKLLEHFASIRGGKLFYPYIGSGIGNGPLVELLDGSVKYDFIIGIGAHYGGHSNLDIMSSAIDAALTDVIMQGHLQQNTDAIALSEMLVKASGLDHCFITTTGAMANENALKIIYQKKFPASRIIAFEHCFMGRTLTMSQVTDKPSFREGLPANIFVDYIPFYDQNRPEESTQEALKALQELLARHPKQYAALCLELVQGEGGFNVGSKAFFKALIELARKNDIAILVDEVQTFGRTQELFAFQYFGLQDDVDLVTIGKLSQVCATLFRKSFAPRPGLLSQTFTASTSAFRASYTIIHELIHGGYFGPKGKINQLHTHFVKGLEALASRFPGDINGPWGIGAMVAFTPFNGKNEVVTRFAKTLFDEGVISFLAGSDMVRCRFLLPILCVKETDIDKVLKIIEKTLVQCKEMA